MLPANQFSFGKIFNKIHKFLKKLSNQFGFGSALGFILVAGFLISYGGVFKTALRMTLPLPAGLKLSEKPGKH